MGLREEINELRAYYKSLPTPECVENFGEDIFADVLSLLDESLQDPEGWELVAEDVFIPLSDSRLWGIILEERGVRQDDRIAIYRKRPQGDSREKEE